MENVLKTELLVLEYLKVILTTPVMLALGLVQK